MVSNRDVERLVTSQAFIPDTGAPGGEAESHLDLSLSAGALLGSPALDPNSTADLIVVFDRFHGTFYVQIKMYEPPRLGCESSLRRVRRIRGHPVNG